MEPPGKALIYFLECARTSGYGFGFIFEISPVHGSRTFHFLQGRWYQFWLGFRNIN
jgi:hypothetical protein